MIYILNKKIIAILLCICICVASIIHMINNNNIFNNIDVFSNSPVEEDLYFPAFNVKIDKNDKIVALTFDDGPNSKYTEKILDYLESKNIVATFFVLGINLKGNNNILNRMVKIGCEIGNHGYNHQQLAFLKDKEITRQISYVDNYVRNATGFSIRAVRTPYGEKNNRIIKLINRPIVLWSIDSEDWILKDEKKIANKVLNEIDSGSIILLHDIFDFSYEATILIVESLLAQGYKFVTVSQMFDLESANTNGLVFRNK